jgi:hypothetical protein
MENEDPQGLGRQFSAVLSSPVVLVLAIVIGAGAIWGALHLSYETILGNKDRHIALLERRVAEYRDAVSGATADEARRRIDAMELELQTLRLRLHPRRLTQEQRQAVIDRSRLPAGAQPRGLTVVIEMNCSDCAAFAESLVAALRDSQGWSVNTIAAATFADRSPTGLAIRVSSELRPPPEAVVLQRALRSARLDFRTFSGNVDPDIELLVTERVAQ